VLSSTSPANRQARSSGNKPGKVLRQPLEGRNVPKGGSCAGQSPFLDVHRTEWIVGGLITLAAVHLHTVYLLHAGGLWRDEAACVQIATQPTLLEMWQMLTYESFPALLHVIIRVWTAIGLGGRDLHLRWLGLGIGLTLLASLWFAARLMRRGVPVVSLALLALNVTVIRYGDSLRAYGLGSALNILVLVLMWRFVRKPTPGRGVRAVLAAVLSVQCLYQNAFFVFAACCGACTVCTLERQWRKAMWTIGMGAAAAISLVPYVTTILRWQESVTVMKVGFQPTLIWESALIAMGFPLVWFNIVWVLLVLLAIGSACGTIPHGVKAAPAPDHPMLAIYSAVALVVGLMGFSFVLKVTSLHPRCWYYLPLMGFMAVCLDAILPTCLKRGRMVLAMFAALTAMVAYPLGLPAMNYRQTNIDLLAARLTKEAAPDDFIIVYPFYCGSTFYRYYLGKTPWTTVPPLEDYRLQRYDLIKAKMQMENPTQPVLDKVAATLQSGNRVWLVGWIPLDGKPPPDVRPAPNNPWGWHEAKYTYIWGAQVAYFIVTCASQGTVVVAPSANGFNPDENLPLQVVSGWTLPLPNHARQ
jgi:hypothetical protein